MKMVPFERLFAEDAWRLTNQHRQMPVSLPEFLEREARWPTSDLRLRWLGFENECAVALGQIAYSPYVPQDHLSVAIIVDRHWRCEGRGGAMLALLEAEMKASGLLGLVATLPEAGREARRWAQERGFRHHALHCDWLLDLHGFERRKWVPTGVSFSDMTGAQTADWLEVAQLLQTLVADAPDMDGLPPWTITRCLSIIRDGPVARPDWVITAREDGNLVGLTIGHSMGDAIYSYFTGVVSRWRGRGLGRELKSRLIESARRCGVPRMRSTNLDTNISALRLNEALGFHRIPGSVELRKLLELA